MSELAVFVAGAAILILLLVTPDWRTGMLLCLMVGFAQEPFRKIMPGTPVYFTGLVIVAAAIVVMRASGDKLARREHLFGSDRTLSSLVRLYVMLVIGQAGMAYARFGVLMVSFIGLIAYLSPLPALWMSFLYPRRPADIHRFILTYCLGAVVFGASGILAYLGVQSPLFKEVGEGFKIYSKFGEIMLQSGLARAPEVLAWHCATGTCLLIVLSVSTQTRALRVFCVAAIGVLLLAALLTARRKALVEVVGFVALFPALLFYFRNIRGHGALLSLMGLVAIGAGLFLANLGDVSRFAGALGYLDRGSSGLSTDEITDRFSLLGLESMSWAIDRAGWFGLGAGTGSQGVQHYVDVNEYARGAAEGGLGKIIVELGIPALLLLAWIVVRGARYVVRLMWQVRRVDSKLSTLMLGFLAWIIINGVAFVAASQIYGDPFILLILGWLLGHILSSPRLIAAQQPVPTLLVGPQQGAFVAERDAAALR